MSFENPVTPKSDWPRAVLISLALAGAMAMVFATFTIVSISITSHLASGYAWADLPGALWLGFAWGGLLVYPLGVAIALVASGIALAAHAGFRRLQSRFRRRIGYTATFVAPVALAALAVAATTSFNFLLIAFACFALTILICFGLAWLLSGILYPEALRAAR